MNKDSDLRSARAATPAAYGAVADQEGAEETLRQSLAEFKDLFDHAPVGYHEVDAEGRLVRINQTELDMLGYTREELLGQFVWKISAEEAVSRNALVAKLSGEPPPRVFQRLLRRKDGSVFPALIEDQLVRRADGAVIGIRAVIQDISVRVKLEEALREANENLETKVLERTAQLARANSAKSDFLANMSHELRTPLNGIIGFSEILIDNKVGDLNPKQSECLAHILSSGLHLLKLINDVLDLSKVEAGKMEFYPETFAVEKALEEVGAIVAPTVLKKNLRLRRQVHPAVAEVTLDPQKFRQVVLNLLSNAVKFTPDGGAVDVVLEPDGDSNLRLRVRDTGIGIPRESLDQLFQVFQQLNSSPARRHTGTGLGLALTKKIVELQGGVIGVESTPGQGSLFTVVLPRVGKKITA